MTRKYEDPKWGPNQCGSYPSKGERENRARAMHARWCNNHSTAEQAELIRFARHWPEYQ